MADTVNSGKYAVDKLNGDNYQLWKTKMEWILMRDELWDIVTEPKPEAVAEHAAWEKKNNKAKAIIGMSVDDSQLVHLIRMKTAQDMWNELRKLHERSTMCSKLYLLRKLYKMRISPGEDMTNHIGAIMAMVGQLYNLGTDIPKEQIVAVMLCSLPDSYDTLITALEARAEADLTIEYVRGKLIDEWKRRLESEQASSNDAAVALRAAGNTRHQGKGSQKKKFSQQHSQKQKEMRECYHCKERGHLKRNCPILKNTSQISNASQGKYRDTHRGMLALGCGHIGDRENQRLCKVSHTAGKDNCTWYIDSGATCHMTSNRSFFQEFCSIEEKIYLADESFIQAEGKGHGYLSCLMGNGKIIDVAVRDVLYIPKLEGGLLSVNQMTTKGLKVVFEESGCIISDEQGILAHAVKDRHLYKLQEGETRNKVKCVQHKECIHLWHRRLGHRDSAAVNKMFTEGLVKGMNVQKCATLSKCECCIVEKMAQCPFPTSDTKTKAPLELIHSDVCGPMPTATPSGNRYIMTLIDDYSHYTYVYLLKHKSEVTDRIKEYVAQVTNKFKYKPTTLRSDNGREYVNEGLKTFLKQEGIEHQFTVPYTPQQNGVAERKNRSIVEMTKCILTDGNLEEKYWGEAICTAVYLQNRLPSRALTGTPYEAWNGTKPNLKHLRIIGSKVFSYIPKEKRRKFDKKAKSGVLIGYDKASKGYRILDKHTGSVWISRSVRIIEDNDNVVFNPVDEITSEKQNMSSQDVDTTKPEGVTEIYFNENLDIPSDNEQDFLENEENVEKPTHTPRRSERQNKGIPPKRFAYCVKADQVKEPASWDEIMKLAPREQMLWKKAAQEEMDSLVEREVWKLSSLPEGKRAVSCKWIFKKKFDYTGNKHTFKARLVARGFSQRYGEDYDQTFAPVVRHETVRTLLSVAAMKKLHVRHFDVKCAFLHGDLDEEIFMEQPQGFVKVGEEEKVLKLQHSIYGLKQSARAWNKKANEALQKQGFTRSKADPGLYTRSESNGSYYYVLVYVDDLLVVGENYDILKEIGTELNKNFYTKDLGDVSNYLGIQIEREEDGSFFLHQGTKIAHLLEDYDMTNAKPAATPMEKDFHNATKEQSDLLPNNNKYRQAVGSLLYLATVTRPDIAAAVGILCQRVAEPRMCDWTAIRRIMRYLKKTQDLGLRLAANCEPKLKGFVDADWAGDRRDRKSTSGYLFQVGTGTIAWSSKKQKTVAMSSTEAEYVAAAQACQEIIWLRQLMDDMGLGTDDATDLYEDNQGCIKLIEADFSGARSKHIDVKYHLLRDLRERQIINVKYCPTEQMTADMLTKPLAKDRLKRLVQQAQMTLPPGQVREGVLE